MSRFPVRRLLHIASRSGYVVVLLALLAATLLCLAWSSPYENSIADTHGWLGVTIAFVAGCVWVTETQPRIAFTAMVASSAALIVPEHLGLGLVGIAMLFAAEWIRANAERDSDHRA